MNPNGVFNDWFERAKTELREDELKQKINNREYVAINSINSTLNKLAKEIINYEERIEYLENVLNYHNIDYDKNWR